MSKEVNISRGCSFTNEESGEISAQNVVGGHKMEIYDWVDKLPKASNTPPQIVEVRFKNTRKCFFVNNNNLPLKTGEIVAVEGSPGTDIGIVTIVSRMVVEAQIKSVNLKQDRSEYKKVLRYATPSDIAKWGEAISREHQTMILSRRISAEMGLEMKIGDVEYQGDGMKAIFYYIADGRVDFRELIKVLFERFRVRIEMKQIGARQESGRIGGIGACGRELCCSSWMNHFSTIGIGAAKAQDLSFNPQKLAGQCGKLKCCLNYEVDTYLDAKKKMPYVKAPLEALDGTYYLVSSDPLAGKMFFSPSPNNASVQIELSAKRVREILIANSRGEKVSEIRDTTVPAPQPRQSEPELQNDLEDSLTRFDRSKRNGKGGGNNNRQQRRGNNQNKGNKSAAQPKAENGNNNNGRSNNNRRNNRNTTKPNNNNAKREPQKKATE